MFNIPRGFKPMKGVTVSTDQVKGPVYGSPKIDGFRCIGSGGMALSSALKPIPNLFVQEYFAEHARFLDGLDGEITVGPVTDPKVFDNTSGPLKRKHGEPDFTLNVFDTVNKEYGFSVRDRETMDTIFSFNCYCKKKGIKNRLVKVPQYLLVDTLEINNAVNVFLGQGYEGAMLRSLDGPYKFGRSTLKEGYLLRVKPFIDDEAVILGLNEAQENNNEKAVNERGLSQRSSHKAGKVGKGTLGGFRVRVITGHFKGTETTIATGNLTKEERQEIWDAQQSGKIDYTDQIMTFKHMEHSAGYEKPRHATFLRFRPDFDVERG